MHTNRGQTLRRLKKHPRIFIGGTILFIIAVLALFAPWIAPHDPNQQNLRLSNQAQAPGYPLGTDQLGRCIFSRILYGARISLSVGFTAVFLGAAVGGLLGLMGGLGGPILDSLIMRVMDVMLAIPGILLAIAIVASLGPNLYNVMLAVGISSIPTYARVVRGSVLSIRETEYVMAARALGAKNHRIAFRHIIPNILAPVMVVATMQLGTAILVAAGLSFLGLGAQPPTAEWGSMLSRGREFLRRAPHIPTYPGLAIFITVIGFNFLGDGLRDYFDPRLKM